MCLKAGGRPSASLPNSVTNICKPSVLIKKEKTLSNIQLSILFIFSLTFISCNHEAQNPIEVTAYTWNRFDTADLGISKDTEFSIRGNSVVKIEDSIIFVLPTDMNDFLIVTEEQDIPFVVKQNPYFDSSWTSLPLGTIPTPLTNEQVSVFQNYSSYRLLNEPIHDYLNSEDAAILDSINGKVSLLNFWYYGAVDLAWLRYQL